MTLFEKFAQGLAIKDFLARHGSEHDQRRWQATYDDVALTSDQSRFVAPISASNERAGFGRRLVRRLRPPMPHLHALCRGSSGAWTFATSTAMFTPTCSASCRSMAATAFPSWSSSVRTVSKWLGTASARSAPTRT